MSSFKTLRHFIKTYKFNSMFTKIFLVLTTFSLAMLLAFYSFTANASAKKLVEETKAANLRIVKQTANSADLLLESLSKQMHSTLLSKSVIPVVIAPKGQSTEKFAALTGQLGTVVRNDKIIIGASLHISLTGQVFCSDGLVYPMEKYRGKASFEEYFAEPYKNLIGMEGIHATDLRNIGGKLFMVQQFPEAINMRAGTIMFELDSGELARTVSGLNEESGSLISVYDKDGAPVINGIPYYGQLLSNGVLGDGEGTFMYTPTGEAERIFFYYTSPDTGWVFMSSMPSSELKLKLSPSSGVFFPFVLFFLTASLCLSLYVTVLILRPVDNLIASVTQPQKSRPDLSDAKNELDFFAIEYNNIRLRRDAFADMMSNVAPTVLERLLTGYLQGKEISSESAAAMLQNIPTKFKENDRYIVMAVQLSQPPGESPDPVGLDFYMISAENVIYSVIDKESCVAIRTSDIIIAVVMRFLPDTSATQIKNAAIGFKHRLFEGIRELPYDLYVGKGQAYNHVSDIYYSYRGALDDLRYQFYTGKSGDMAGNDGQDNEKAYFVGRIAHIIENIDEHNYMAAAELCGRVVSELSAGTEELSVAKNICTLLTDALIEKLLSFKASLNDPVIEEKKLTDNNIASCDSLESICEYMTSFYKDVMPRFEIYNRKEQHRYILRAKDCIENNYSDHNLSQNMVAEYVGINPSYLSRLFKESTGTGLLDYINEYRVERAKELLKSTALPVKEIGYKTGFQSMPTFFRVFKKYSGISPGQYRE